MKSKDPVWIDPPLLNDILRFLEKVRDTEEYYYGEEKLWTLDEYQEQARELLARAEAKNPNFPPNPLPQRGEGSSVARV